MRKYILSGAVISAALGAVSIVRTTRQGPRDWRLALAWLGWGISVAIAVGNVIEKDKDASALR